MHIKLHFFTHSPHILTARFSTVALNHVHACFFEVYFKLLQTQNEKRMVKLHISTFFRFPDAVLSRL